MAAGIERCVEVPAAGDDIRKRRLGQGAHIERERDGERHGAAAGGVGVARLFDGGAVARDAGLFVVACALDGGDAADVVLADDLAEVKQAHAVFRAGERVAAGQGLHMTGVGLGVLDGQTGQVERGELVATAVDLTQVRVFRHVERGELVVLAVERHELREVFDAGQVGDAVAAAVELRHVAQLERREPAVAVDVGGLGEQGAEGRIRERGFIERDAAGQSLHLKIHGHGRQALAPGVVLIGEIVRRFGIHGGAGLLVVVCVRHARNAADVVLADDGVQVHGALLPVRDGAGLLRQVLRAEDRVCGLAVALRGGIECGAAAQVERGERVVAAVERLERGAACQFKRSQIVETAREHLERLVPAQIERGQVVGAALERGQLFGGGHVERGQFVIRARDGFQRGAAREIERRERAARGVERRERGAAGELQALQLGAAGHVELFELGHAAQVERRDLVVARDQFVQVREVLDAGQVGDLRDLHFKQVNALYGRTLGHRELVVLVRVAVIGHVRAQRRIREVLGIDRDLARCHGRHAQRQQHHGRQQQAKRLFEMFHCGSSCKNSRKRGICHCLHCIRSAAAGQSPVAAQWFPARRACTACSATSSMAAMPR